MPLAAMFTLAMLAWYGWWETSQRVYLAAFYAFLALATLAGWLRTRARASQSVSAMFAALFVPSARTETVDAALESAGLVASESWARPGENRVVRLRLPVDSESHDP